MPLHRPRASLWRRAANACLRGCQFAVRGLFVLILLVLPIPLLPVPPRMGKPDRRNVPGQVKPRE